MYLTKECAALARWMESQAKKRIEEVGGRKNLVFLFDPDDEAAFSYVRQKVKACERVGIRSVCEKFANRFDPRHFFQLSCYADGIIVQEPYPEELDNRDVRDFVAACITPSQDVDGLYYQRRYVPATALGIYFLLKFLFRGETKGVDAAVLGRSWVTGLPIAEVLSRLLDMNVSIYHSKSGTEALLDAVESTVCVSCIGKPKIIGPELFSLAEEPIAAHSVFVDVGFGRDKNGKPCGDIDPAIEPDHIVTPVPGGVGPLTVAALMLNTAYGYSPTGLKPPSREELLKEFGDD